MGASDRVERIRISQSSLSLLKLTHFARLLFGENRMTLAAAILLQYTFVTDTDGRSQTTSYTQMTKLLAGISKQYLNVWTLMHFR